MSTKKKQNPVFNGLNSEKLNAKSLYKSEDEVDIFYNKKQSLKDFIESLLCDYHFDEEEEVRIYEVRLVATVRQSPKFDIDLE